jgi:tetratricopeptide (TPR) repeat protein
VKNKRILELSPEFRREQTMLAGAHCNLGNVLKSQAQLDVVLAEYDQAIKLLTENLARNPLDSQTTNYLRNSRIWRAGTLSRQSRFPEALTEFDLVRASAPREFNASLRSHRATCLARTNPAEAVAEAKAM